MLTRRSLLAGFGALVAAPAVIRTPGLLMPVRTIAAAPWVLDPVAMAARCVATIGETVGARPATCVAPNGTVHRYMEAISRELDENEARNRVQAYVDREPQPRTLGLYLANESRREAGELRLKIGGKLHLCRPHEAIFA